MTYGGWMLELSGIIAIALGIAKTLTFFDRPGVLQRFVDWMRRCPVIAPKPRRIAGQMHAIGTAGEINAAGRLTAKASGVEARLSILEGRMEAAESHLDGLSKRVKDDVARIHSAIREEREARSRSVSELNSRLELLSVNDLDLELVGTAWVLIGLTLATVPDLAVWAWQAPYRWLTF